MNRHRGGFGCGRSDGVCHNGYDVATNYYKLSHIGFGRGDGYGEGFGNLLNGAVIGRHGYVYVYRDNNNKRVGPHWGHLVNIIIELKMKEIHG